MQFDVSALLVLVIVNIGTLIYHMTRVTVKLSNIEDMLFSGRMRCQAVEQLEESVIVLSNKVASIEARNRIKNGVAK